MQIIGMVFNDAQFYCQDVKKAKHGKYEVLRNFNIWLDHIYATDGYIISDKMKLKLIHFLNREKLGQFGDARETNISHVREFLEENGFSDHNKYKNNYDYHLAIYLLNKVPYMSNDCLLMVENDLPFSAVSVLHYKYYNTQQEVENYLQNNESIQCAVGNNLIPFGDAQNPSLHEYADGVDTMAFLTANY